MGCAAPPDWILQSGESVDDECLCCQQDDCDFNDHEIFRFREDAKGNDHRSRAGRRMIDAQQDQDGPGKCEGERGCQNAWPVDLSSRTLPGMGASR